MTMEIFLGIGGATLFVAVIGLIGVLFKTLLGGKELGVSERQKFTDDLQEELTRRDRRLDAMDMRMRGMEADRERDHLLIAGLRRAYVELRQFIRKAGLVPPPSPEGLGVDDSDPRLPAVAARTQPHGGTTTETTTETRTETRTETYSDRDEDGS